MSDGNVVALPGHSVPTPRGEPVPNVVEICREALEQAERGEIVAVAIAKVVDDGTACAIVETDFCAKAGSSFDLYAALGKLKRRFDAWLDD